MKIILIERNIVQVRLRIEIRSEAIAIHVSELL